MNALAKHATRAAVSATGLRKVYGEKVVLDGVDLSIEEGEVFALLGPNGAGKTTTIRILSTLIAADAGTASVLGHDPRGEAGAVRAVIGVTGQFSAVDDLLTGEENLLLIGRLLHLPAAERRARAARLLERFDLVEAARQTPATYSGGMKRRLDIAMTLMGRPRLIFLDEPTTGLDPRSRHIMWQLIRDLVAEGVWIADKRDAIGDPEFRAIYLEYDAAFDWSPDDPRLSALADRTARWMASRYGRSEGTPRPAQDPAIAQLVTTPAGVWSPAWDRLTEIAKQRQAGR